MKWVWRGLLAIVALLVAAFLIFRTPDTDAAEMRAKYGGPPSQFVDIGGGVTVHLRDEGPKDAPAILLLHGSNADLHTWEPWAAALKGEYRVIRFDQVGHGLTGPDPQHDYSRDNYVADVRQVADKLGLDRFILGGNSMGGKHALAFAAAHPERVAGLVLVDASGGPMLEDKGDKARKDSGGGNIGFTIAQTPGINLLVEQITPRGLIAQSLEQSVSVKSVASEAAVDRYWELLRYPGNRRATLKRFGYPYEPLTEGEIAAITAPTLILWGEEDRLIPLAAGQWLAKTMPNATLKAYPQIGHLPQEEAVSATLADLGPWLTDHAPAPKPE
ncbi:alpha/beta fold hydrolase [Porphyrobacter sp. AAP60]|uniref:alpha/beta fold hydrolase n=1 Tax=Porphyrobacter sp. AAP60 TaxID=1523423 RepID=UPI0006B9602C|nr:alpha/beta hydrolase [Porphyrobacter sp. AAP60]KPF64777.1 alpha/beta hydrolase [Porphyrobacter sp. AAP60]